MTLKNRFVTEVYIRLSGEEEFTCTTRFAGFPVSVRRVRLTKPRTPSRIEELQPESSVRRTDYRIEARRQGEG
ncbi:MAG: hypothetical protein ABSB35_03635 [Bryobacteraceae bacterium]|jgi:hypothetical protein